MGHEFLTGWDDPTYVTKNEAIRGINVEHIRTAFTTYYVGNYAPMQILSYMLDYSLWGMKASGFLFTNIFFHAASGIMLYLILARIYRQRVWIFLAALLFLLHPVQVESVVWISQRKNVLAMFFFLFSWYGYIVYSESKGNRARVAYCASLATFSIALLAKSVTVILPLVLLLHNLCFRERLQRQGFLTRLIPYTVIAGAVALLALQSQSPEFDGGRVHAYYGGSLLNTAFTMLPVLARYLGMLLFPIHLSAWYDPPIRSDIDMSVALSGLMLIALVGAGAVLWQRKRDLCFWYILFFIGLIPVSQIVPLTTLMNDRYLYFPMLGAAPFVCALLLPSATTAVLPPGRQLAMAAVLTIAVMLCAVATLYRSTVWKDSVTLWRDTVVKAPSVHLVHHGLGCALLQAGSLDEAIAELTIAMQLNSGNVETYNQLGIAYGKKGEFDKAIALFEAALKLDPASEPVRKNLATARYGREKFGGK